MEKYISAFEDFCDKLEKPEEPLSAKHRKRCNWKYRL